MKRFLIIFITISYLLFSVSLDVYAFNPYPTPSPIPTKPTLDDRLNYINDAMHYYAIVYYTFFDYRAYPNLQQTIKDRWLAWKGYDSVQEAEEDLNVPLKTDYDWTQIFHDSNYITHSNIAVTYSVQAQNDLKDILDDYIDNHGYYYAYSVGPFLPSQFSQKQYYDNYIAVLKDKGRILQSNYFSRLNDPYIYSYPDDINYIYNKRKEHIIYNKAYTSSWESYISNFVLKINYGVPHNNDFLVANDTVFALSDELDVAFPNTTTGNELAVVSLVPEQFLVFRTLADFKNYTGGILPYYQGEGYDPNFVASNVTTITDSQIDNSITYNDIVNYVTNNNGATSNDVYNYINNYSGSEGGGSGGNGGINLDWLGSLGTLLGSILNGLGQLINNLLNSIIDTVTSIVDNLNTLISGIGNIIPESFTLLINAVFGWLPDEVRALIIGSVTLMIFVGIIKLIRG